MSLSSVAQLYFNFANNPVINERIMLLRTCQLRQQVDGSFPGRHRDLQPIITWKSSNTPVSKKFTLPIPVELSGSVVDYRYMVLEIILVDKG